MGDCELTGASWTHLEAVARTGQNSSVPGSAGSGTLREAEPREQCGPRQSRQSLGRMALTLAVGPSNSCICDALLPPFAPRLISTSLDFLRPSQDRPF